MFYMSLFRKNQRVAYILEMPNLNWQMKLATKDKLQSRGEHNKGLPVR